VVPRLALVIAVCGLFGAEAIHTAVIQEHIDEWLPFGLFFLGLSITEGLLAVALITKPSRWVIRLVIGVSLGTVVLWLYTRTVGVPLGPMAGHVEELGRLDTACSVLELMTAGVLLAKPAGFRTRPRRLS
jgi:hypothetical protein